MTDSPRRVVTAIAALAVIWILVFWLYQPAPPKVSFGQRPPSVTETDISRAASGLDDAAPKATAPAPPTAAPKVTAPPAPAKPPSPPPDPATGPRPPPTREYTVRAGDVSLDVIAQRELGNRKRGEEIARLNPYVDPTKLIPGRTVLHLPVDPPATAVAAAPQASAPAPAAPPPAPPAKPESPTPAPAGAAGDSTLYTVAADDTFSSIAKKVYGQSSLWKVIADANREAVPEPRALKPGMVIKIPPKPTSGGAGG